METTGESALHTRVRARAGILPSVRTQLSAPAALEALRTASRRGRLPGFAPLSGTSFCTDAFSEPFDRTLHGELAADGSGSVIRFVLRARWKLPAIFAVVAALSVWPGVWLTESLMETWFPGSWIAHNTYAWYLPLSMIPLPWAAWAMWQKTARAAHASAMATIPKIAAEVSGVLEDPGSH
jgi:hypothetical protein